MPIYEFGCTKCGHVLEVLQRIDDPPPRRCRKCRGKLEKLVSRTSFQLKGGGWFDAGYSKSGTSDASEKPSPPKSDSSKKKSKPAKKASSATG